MKFEAEHEECLCVCPYMKNGEVVVHLYVYVDESGIPMALKTAAQEFFEPMRVKLEWSDLYNDAYNVLNVTSIEYPSGKPNRLEASQVDEIDEVINKHLDVFSKHRNITAVQPAFKITNSVQTEEACIAVYVLGKGNIPLGETAIPCKIDCYPVDIVNGFCVRTAKPKKPTEAHEHKEVLCLGASIGVNGENSSGTLGAFVEDANSGTWYVLSCDHVMNHADKSELIYPGLDVYLNCLHYHLKEYRTYITRITGRDCNLPQLSDDILQDPEKLSEMFNELKTIKEKYSNSPRCSKTHLQRINTNEKKFEEVFSKPPRVIANYSAGVRCNMVSAKNSGKEYFTDAAISELTEHEKKELKISKSITIIGSSLTPSGECIPATTVAIMNDKLLCKSGSTTGFTESGRIIDASRFQPTYMYIRASLQENGSAWIDKKCIICEQREAAQSQVQEFSSPCEMCKPDTWLKRCLCILREGTTPFSHLGDSGAVVFEIPGENEEAYCDGFGIIFAVHYSSYYSYTLASPLEIVLEELSKKVSASRRDGKPCVLRLASESNSFEPYSTPDLCSQS